MLSSSQPWLPESALAGALAKRLAEVARDWSLKWLAEGSLRSVGGFAPVEAAVISSEPDELALRCEDVLLTVSARGCDRIAAALVRRPPNEQAQTALDDILLRALTRTALEDFGRMAAPACALGSTASWASFASGAGPAVPQPYNARFEIEDGSLIIQIARDRLVRARMAALPPPPRLPPPAAATAALGRTELCLEARIGACRLALSDLGALAPGDVLVLDADRRVASTLRLVPSGNPVALGSLAIDAGRWRARLSTVSNNQE